MRTVIQRLPRAFALLLGIAALLLALLPAAPAAAEGSPWWQLLSGSRPTNLWEPEDEVQELVKTGAIVKIEAGAAKAACFAASSLACEIFGYPYSGNTLTAANLQTALEAPAVYGPGGAVVEETSASHFKVTSPGRWVAPLKGVSGASAKVLNEGGSGRLFVIATNLGDKPVDATSVPVRIVDRMPAGVAAYGAEAVAGPTAGVSSGKAGPVACELPSSEEVVCEFEGELPSYEAIEVEIYVSKVGGAGAPGRIAVSGGDAEGQEAAQTVKISPDPVGFGIEGFSAEAQEEGGPGGHGKQTEQAGAHPFQWVNTVTFNSGAQHGANRRSAFVDQPGQPRNVKVKLPAGLVGNATAVPTCPMTTFLAHPPENVCPPASVVGVASVTFIEGNLYGLQRLATPIVNLPPAHGEPARFGFVGIFIPVIIGTEADPDDHYRITGAVINAPQDVQVLSSTLSLWGWPGDPRHDNSRDENCFLFRPDAYPGECEPPESREEKPFLRMPVACNAELDYPALAEPWNTPLGSVVSRLTAFSPPLRGCNHEPFDPGFSLTPTSKAAESPSGLDAEVSMPNAGLNNPADGAISETQFKKAEVTLPEGVTVNPSQAEGLATCSPGQYGAERFDSAPGEGCPEASKIGSVKIKTPLLEEEVEGALYVATPYENPFESLIAVYLVARIPNRGILVKQAGVVRPDPSTGQLVTTFDDVPQVPIDYFKLHFREGARAPLVTPPACGTYNTQIRFTPWSAHDPNNPAPDEILEKSVPFTIERGVNGGACPPGGLPPFAPQLEAGTASNAAGAFSPFLVRLTRTDGEQEFTHFSIKLPPGVAGKLAGIPFCSEAAIAAATRPHRHPPRRRRRARRTLSCPAASELGSTFAAAGVGQVLAYAPGKVYLAGPYHGAPISMVAITAAKVGPFDLGTVVVRLAIDVNPETGEVFLDSAGSDPLPHILQGIPVHLREVRAVTDRPEFTFNPTSCERMSTAATVLGSGLDFVSAADDNPFVSTSPFQAADCANLGYKPKLGLRLRGATKRGGNPALRAVLAPRAGDANSAAISVALPHSEFLDQAHIRTVCTRVQFNAGAGNGAGCPAGSIYGHARAWTPLLSDPLEGNVYLRSSEHPLPDLVLALHGLIDINAVGRIDSVKGGIRNTFDLIPDAPVSKVVVSFEGGKKGLLENSTDLCAAKHRATANYTGQNGKTYNAKPVLQVKCKKHHKRKHKRHHKRANKH